MYKLEYYGLSVLLTHVLNPVARDRWQGAPSCINISSGLYKPSNPWLKTAWYAVEFRICGHLTNILFPSALIIPQTSTEYPPYLIVLGRRTNFLRLECLSTRHSSEKMTLPQSVVVNNEYALHHLILFFIWTLFKSGFFDATRPWMLFLHK